MLKSQTKKEKIVLAGGGSGGHVMPLLSVWEFLKDEYEVLFLCSNQGKEEKILADKKVYFKTIWAGKLRRYFDWQNLVDFFKTPIGIAQSYFILRSYRPVVVLAKGGYVSVPVGIAAWLLGIPLVTHESDAVMGLANRILARFATKIAVAFPVGRYQSQDEKKMIWTGMPVRKWKYQDGDKEKIREEWGLNNQLPVIFITGGSQGAKKMNSYVMDNLDKILQFANVIHQTGELDFPRLERKKMSLTETKGKYLIYDFLIDEYDRAMVLADLVIARAGSTLADISNLAKPSILIPLPSSASNHQFYNAKSFDDMGAAVMLEERDFNKINLAVLAESILSDEERMEEMASTASTAMKTEGSAQILVDIIKDTIRQSREKNSN